MPVKVSKPSINVREELADLRKPTGVAGEAMLRAETVAEQQALIGVGRRNILINGDMRIAQRSTSISTIGPGTFINVDRWVIQTNKNQTTHTFAQVADAPSGFYYSSKLTVGTGAVSSGSDYGRIMYSVEGYDATQTGFGSADAKAVTLSFWTKSSVSGTFGGTIKLQFASPYPGFYFTYTINSANTWEYKTVTIDAGTFTSGSMSHTNGLGLLLVFDIGEGPNRSTSAGYSASTDGGTLGVTGVTKILATSGATWQITGVQLEVGKVATPFEHRSFAEELALCQRYTYVIGGSGVTTLGGGSMYTSTAVNIDIPLPVQMRDTSPSLTPVPNGTGNWLNVYVGATGTVSNATPQVGDGVQASLRLYATSAHSGSSPSAAGAAVWCMVLAGAKLIISEEL